MLGPDRRSGFDGGGFVEIEDGDAGAVRREHAGGRHADAARRRAAGNDGDLAVE